MLRDHQCLFALGAPLKILLLEKPGNSSDPRTFDHLADFIEAADKEDAYFAVFPYHF